MKSLKPLHIINESKKVKNNSLIKIKIPKPRPPILPALKENIPKGKKIKIIAIKKMKTPKTPAKRPSKSFSVERPKSYLIQDHNHSESRCKTCIRHNKNFRDLSP